MTGPEVANDAASAIAPASDEEGERPGGLLRGVFKSAGAIFRNDPAENDAITTNPEHSLGDQQKQLLANVERLGAMRVSDAMVPRADIVAIEVGATLDDAVEAFSSEGHSRLPVYQETLDDALGFIHVKDVFMASAKMNGSAADNFSARRYLRRFLTVPPSMPCISLLEKMQAERLHLAVVIDEFGGVDGLVTIEDLLELIVGDIEDEHDTEDDADWTRLPDGSYRADARSVLEDFEQQVGIHLGDEDRFEDVETLGGLVFLLCNRVPARGEVIQHPHGHEFEVLDADPRRVKVLRIMLVQPSGAPEGEPATVDAAQ